MSYSASPPGPARKAAVGVTGDIGLPLGVFRVGPGKVAFFGAFGVLCAVIPAVFLIQLQLAGGLPVGAYLIAVFAPAVGLLTFAVRLSRLRVIVGEHGIDFWGAKGRQILRWDGVHSLWRKARPEAGGVLGRFDRLILAAHDGKHVYLEETIARYRQLYQLIEDRLAAHQLPAARADLDAGKELAFGPVRVSRDRVHHQESSVARDQIETCEIADGRRLVLRLQGEATPWVNVEIHNIQNYHLLPAILRPASEP